MGKTVAVVCHLRKYQEHPHGRGENVLAAIPTTSTRGTSPRAWGKRNSGKFAGRLGRNIPTGVGKTRGRKGQNLFCPEHPHGRGENRLRTSGSTTHSGTSPRAWGKRIGNTVVKIHRRNIPTGVGKTADDYSSSWGCTEHPHGRGENFARRASGKMKKGTSPRAWGKQLEKRVHLDGKRNIPTGVGKTNQSAPRIMPRSEHPHGRGENPDWPPAIAHTVGTSPRAWGKLQAPFSGKFRTRNIPTGVGKTTW